jgi:hypothetical protein
MHELQNMQADLSRDVQLVIVQFVRDPSATQSAWSCYCYQPAWSGCSSTCCITRLPAVMVLCHARMRGCTMRNLATVQCIIMIQ